MPTSSRCIAPIRTLLVVCVAVSARPATVPAQVPGYAARLDSLFSTLDANHRMMGSITIRKAGRVIYARTLGYRDSTADGWVPSDSATAFRIGSATKPFTAAMIYRLVDAGRLSLGTRLSTFFPQLPNADSITIRDLLAHTSGLGDYAQGMDPMVALDRPTILQRIADAPVQFRAGTQRRYNNGNFTLLGYIVEAVTHRSYEEVLRHEIVASAHLARTRVGGPIVAGTNEAHAYYFSDGHWERQSEDVISNAGGAGSLISTTTDLTRFLSALFERRLISRASLVELTHGFDDGAYRGGKGLGNFDVPATSKTGHSHDGSIGAHTALIGYVPSDRLALALTINGHNYPISRIFFHVWGILFGTAAALPSFTAMPLDEAQRAPMVGTYSAPDYGLTITIRRAGAGLEAQTQGQEAFPLTYIGSNRFQFVRDGILLEFATPTGGASPRFTLFQQKTAFRLVRVVSTP